MIMKFRQPCFTFGIFALLPSLFFAGAINAQSGKDLMSKTDCLACHDTLEKRIGPSFKAIAEKYQANPSAVNMLVAAIKNGGSGNWGQIPMSPHPQLADSDIKKMVMWILEQTGGNGGTAIVPKKPDRPITSADIEAGQALFTGTVRLSHGGPSCISCHDVKNDNVIGGGSLAIELTSTYTRNGIGGIQQIITSPPFPVMRAAYQNKALTEHEAFSISAFLKLVDTTKGVQKKRGYGHKMLGAGLIGVIVMFLLVGLFGRDRKKKLVNQAIYDRQIKSS